MHRDLLDLALVLRHILFEEVVVEDGKKKDLFLKSYRCDNKCPLHSVSSTPNKHSGASGIN